MRSIFDGQTPTVAFFAVAAPDRDRTIDVGAGETRVKAHFLHARTEPVLEVMPIGKVAEANVAPGQFNGARKIFCF